jgi:hypothetical protein
VIDHNVLINNEDVSDDVISIRVKQSNDVDSDPGKIEIVLANRRQKYTNKWPPQKTPIVAIVYNWVYRENDQKPPSDPEPAEYLVATGTMTDNSSGPSEAIVIGECDLGHLADALPNDEDLPNLKPKEILEYILSRHEPPIEFDWDPALDDRNVLKERETYGSDWTFQGLLEDLCHVQLGAIYYFSEANRLQIKDPYTSVGVYDLDPYVLFPDQTTSIMGFRNSVAVIGDQTRSKDPKGISVHGSEPITSQYPHGHDLDSIAEVGWLQAPVYRDSNIKTVDEANKKADDLLSFYKKYENALTTVEVVGIVPPLQSIVEYSPFVPILQDDIDRTKADLTRTLEAMQTEENRLAVEQDRRSRKLALSSKVRGIVVEKDVTYSIDGLKCRLTISPGLVDGVPVTDEDISGSVLNFTEVLDA